VEKAMRQMVDPEGRIGDWSNFDAGGHFPAMEAPDLLMSDARTFFSPLPLIGIRHGRKISA
jgi:hypothetical protein